MKRVTMLMLVLCTCLVLAAWPQVPAKHTVTKFNVPGAGTGSGQGTSGVGLVDDGSIMGWYIDSNTVYHGYLRSPAGKITKFDPPGSQFTVPYGMNSALAITGYYADTNGVYHGFLRSPAGKITKINVSGAYGTIPEDINKKGEIAGLYSDSNGAQHGFVRTPGGKVTTFDAPGAGKGSGQGTAPTSFDGLTDAGAIGGQYTDSEYVAHAFLRAPDGTFTEFDPPGSVATYTTGINSKETIVGFYIDSNGIHGFLRTVDGTITSFDVPNSTGTFANNINSGGTIAGDYADSNNVYHGFSRAPNGHITEFSVLGAGTGANEGTEPYSNNSKGAITGQYVDSNFVNHGFLWQ